MAATAWSVTPDVQKYDEALDWLLKRNVITATAARELDDRGKADSFWIGGGLQLDAIQRVFDKITAALERGTPLEEFRKLAAADLRDPAHTETVFRNAVQRAYNAGRYNQMREPSVLRFRPFWMFDAILDSRTTPICRVCNKIVLPADDPWWGTHVPPMHHRCRSSLRNLTKAVAEERGIDERPTGDEQEAAPGWGHPPTEPSWRPAKNRYEHQLELDFEKRAKTGERTRRPRQPAEHKAKFWDATYRDRYGDAAASLAEGRASLERGLDMKVADARAQLRRLPASMPGFAALHDALEDADGARTIREQGGELDPLRKGAAAVAGHLAGLKPRDPVEHAQLAKLPGGKRALELMTVATGPAVKHAGRDWTFETTISGGRMLAKIKRVVFDRHPGTLEHELGHVIEELNSKLLARAVAFLKARAKGSPLVDHGQAGKCWDDQFGHWYTGKRYADPAGKLFATEATSTAVEFLVGRMTLMGDLSDWIRKDPEHLLFALGQLTGR